MRRHRPGVVVTGLAVTGVALFAASPLVVGSDVVHAAGPMVRYGSAMPAGAQATLDVEYDAGGHTHLTLTVDGFPPGTRYAGRAQAGGCPAEATELAGVFQLAPNPDPERPEDPAYRNPHNEVWLDLETDPSGAATARATQKWQFHPAWRPGSVTIHEMLPVNHPADPVLGETYACLEVAF